MSFSDGNLDYTDLSANAGILGTQIADNTIQTRNLAPQTVINTQIVDETITNVQVAAATLTGANIAPATIDASNIASNTITADQIASGTITATQIESGTITGTQIATDTITASQINTLDMTGKTVTFDTGTIGGWQLGATELIGPTGAVIRSGMTDFLVGTGFFLGNVAGVPKLAIGTGTGNNMSWDGTNLRITGSFIPTSVFNSINYTVSTLPVAPTTVGYNSPGGNA